MADYIPYNDSEFKDWLSNFTTLVTTNKTLLGLGDTDVSALTASVGSVMVDVPAHRSAVAASKAAMRKKTLSRKSAEKAVRKLVKQIQAHPGVTDMLRESMRLSVPKVKMPSPVPTDVPLVKLDYSHRLVHKIFIYSSPTSRKRPEGVMAAEIWMRLAGEAGGNGGGAFTLLATTPKSSYTVDFVQREADVGKRVDYQVRWMNRLGEVGPWSLQASAVVPG